ncbi:keto-hydroxyglutarate-aldolase/keto-deoxy-phosphogluconate aldolase [Gracilibacillus halophilus YIM-C55.5]|uniref:Keto-hydroxyglutarate-aldolase/keto-deoxy-phosphogluconate aldolase n=1 Tax=Gracilibacillus halophilus YIM-C55.5 TaxID=1308866 RepID=N4WTQ0_9BACI|nr:bifunctional 2-keto-4-hydroxyglutarate aldolase/2-keto-3-deoxy-6-phosphogluconate aldolase [Gracilibacillus halophilus]ENH96506.1 keto-hydroxyglutarate-aldolase/keto-deoxy-phosphogluconate aldolase [Gracilibacillus halophilus YIM-C55.5]
MNKVHVLSTIQKQKLVAVIRTDSQEQAIKVADACIDGGIYTLEFTFSIPNVEEVIRTMTEKYQDNKQVIVGAGTVLEAYAAREAITAGAAFVVAPSFDQETAKLCNFYQVPYMPGCVTVSEIKQAMEAGADVVKLFPSHTLRPSFVKAVQAPLPQTNLMPTGGVNLDNLREWLDAGAVAVGIGGNLVAPAKTGEYDKITALARQYVDEVKEVIE